MKLATLLVTLLVSSVSVAGSSNGSAQGSSLNALGAVWRHQHTANQNTSHDITMVYGGEDISRRPTMSTQTAID